MHLLPSETLIADLAPELKLNRVWFLSRGISTAAVTAAVAWLPWVIFNSPAERGAAPPYGPWAGVAAIGVVFVLMLAASFAYLTSLANTYRYSITSKRFIFTGGLLRKVMHAVEHRRVTDVQLAQNLAEQMLGLYSINLFTPGTASVRPNARNQPMPELRLEGIKDGPAVFAMVSECLASAKVGDA